MHARKFGEELNARLQQRQEKVQDLRRELQELQRAHVAGNASATLAARDALQQRLADAERELGSTQRAVSRASDARSKDAAAQTAPPSKP